MEYSLSNSLVGGGGGLNPDKLSLDLPFATTKSLTAAKGPTPDFVRASSGTYFGSNGYLQTAGNNVARFDHETSYIGSTVLAQCIDCADVYNTIFSASERIPLSGIDSNGYPYFLGSLFVISYDFSASQWLMSYDGGNWEAYSTVGLSDEYVPLTNPTIGSNLVTAELACKGLLIEEQSTNFTTYSQLLTNVSWVPTAVTVSVPGTIGPNAATAFEVAETTANSGHNISNTGGLTTIPAASYTIGLSYTFSIFAKSVSVDWIQLSGTGTAFGASQYANFNIKTGVVGNFTGTPGGSPPKIESVGNGWYRCSLTLIATATATGNAASVLFTNNTNALVRAPSYFGNTANKVLLSMAQAEQKAFPTSYIPTTTGSAPRSADLCSITGTKFTGFYNQPEGTILSSSSMPVIPSTASLAYAFDNNADAERHDFRHNTTFFVTQSGGVTQAQFIGTAPTAGSITKFAAAYKVSDYATTKNGSLISPTVSIFTSVPATTQVYIGSKRGTSEFLNGHIQYIKVFKKRLPNAKLQSLTT